MPIQVGTPQGLDLAFFIKQWLVPRQSARRLAGFLHTGDIFSDWNFFGIGNSLNISDFLNFKFGTIHAYLIFVTEMWFVFIVSEWFPTVSWVSAWVCRFIKGREVQTPPGWGEIAWRGLISSVLVIYFEIMVRVIRTPFVRSSVKHLVSHAKNRRGALLLMIWMPILFFTWSSLWDSTRFLSKFVST